jgi:hypothetical protein
MSEGEPRRVVPRPEQILTPEEAELIQRAEWGHLPCLICGEPLQAAKAVSECYEGVILYCPDGRCGYMEF